MTSMTDETAISCENLWMVFGDRAEHHLRDLNARHETLSVPDKAAKLEEQNLVAAVRDVSFSIRRGELFVIMGLSGSGKSTVIRCLSRLLEPTAGKVSVFGTDMLKAGKAELHALRRETIGMVFQHFGLFPHMTVEDNVAFPLRVKGVAREERLARAHEMTRLVGLEGKETAYPRELSGGQRQRVGIARSLAVDPDLWLLDEPFSALDPLIRRQLQDEFLSLQERLNKTIVFITHDITEALKIADRIAIMRDGEIVQIGTPEDIVLRPVDDYIAEFSRDIAKSRMIRLGKVMAPVGTSSPSVGLGLTTRMTAEDALIASAGHDVSHPFAVRNDQGDIIGQIDLMALADELKGDET